MKLQDQVCSLELSKKLKSLGVKQESLFYWRLSYSTSESFIKGVSQGKKGTFGDYRIQLYPYPRLTTADVKWNEKDLAYLDETEISAFTSSELGEMLPDSIQDGGEYDLEISKMPIKGDKEWLVRYCCEENQDCFGAQFGTTETDCRAKMLIYLLENKLINLN